MLKSNQIRLLLSTSITCLCRRIAQAPVNCSKGVALSCHRWQHSSSKDDSEALSENDHVNPHFINRNPRNLEQLGLARKPDGWRLQYPSKTFYHKLLFNKSLQNTEAQVIHNNGRTIVTASTKEFAISKHLYSKNDVSAAHNIGRVLAQRCRESGISCVTVQLTPGQESGESVLSFLQALEDGGIELEEPVPYVKQYEPGVDYDHPKPKPSRPSLQTLINSMVEEEKIKLK